MLFSYQQAADGDLPEHTKRFARAALQANSPEGLVLGPQALASYVGGLHGIQDLMDSVSDDASVSRVDHELKRRFLTGRVPENVTEALVEALEILGLDEQLKVTDIPLVAALSTDSGERHVIINVVGRKSLADAIRTLYARLYTHPYPQQTPDASIILYRMPPLEGTAHVTLEDDGAVVDAVRGWGRLVGVEEVADTYTLRLSGALVGKEVRAQDSMVYRNPRSGEVVQTRPRDATSQKLTDDEARSLVLTTKRLGASQAVFGFSDEDLWLLALREPATPQPVSDSARQENTREPELEETVQESEPPGPAPAEPEQESEIVIVDLEDEPEQEEPHVEVGEPEESSVPEPQKEPTPEADADELEEEDGSWSPTAIYEQSAATEDPDAAELHAASKQTASLLLDQALGSIELTLREWLRGDQPDSFEELVKRVSARRQVPYKNRVLTLQEMREQGAFEQPSPEAVRFALETLERFRKEF